MREEARAGVRRRRLTYGRRRPHVYMHIMSLMLRPPFSEWAWRSAERDVMGGFSLRSGRLLRSPRAGGGRRGETNEDMKCEAKRYRAKGKREMSK